MATRGGFWASGLLLGILVAWGLRPPILLGMEPLVVCVSILTLGLLGELVDVVRTAGGPRTIAAPADARPADGAVEVVAIQGAAGTPNASDPRFSAFRALEGPDAGRVSAGRRGRTSPPLLGRIAVLSVFLGRDGREWSEAEVAEAHAALFQAGRWIEREAIRWGAPVNIALADTYFAVADDEPRDQDVEMTFVPEGEGVGPLEAGAVTKALIDSSRAAAQLGFRDAVDWWARINRRVDADVPVWLLHPRRAGRSLAVPLDLTELTGVSLAVCYAREASFPERLVGPPFTDPVTVVHELLHLFGATDKYGVSLDAFPPRAVSEREIMRLNESMLSRSRIDLQTAWEIGWTRAT